MVSADNFRVWVVQRQLSFLLAEDAGREKAATRNPLNAEQTIESAPLSFLRVSSDFAVVYPDREDESRECRMTSVLAVSPSSAGVLVKASRHSSGFSIFLCVLLTTSGVLAILLPIEMSFGVVIVVSWLLILTGVVQFVHVLRCKGVGHGIWKVLIALIYVTTGVYLRLNLGIGIAALTLAVIAFLVTQGLIDVFAYFRARKTGASGWLLDGAVTLLLGLMIWRHWPNGPCGP